MTLHALRILLIDILVSKELDLTVFDSHNWKYKTNCNIFVGRIPEGAKFIYRNIQNTPTNRFMSSASVYTCYMQIQIDMLI